MKKINLLSAISIFTLSSISCCSITSCSCATNYENKIICNELSFVTQEDQNIGYISFELEKEIPSNYCLSFYLYNNPDTALLTGNWDINGKKITIEIKLSITNLYIEKNYNFGVICQFRNKTTGAIEAEEKTPILSLTYKPKYNTEIIVPNENLNIVNNTLFGFQGEIPSNVNSLYIPENVNKISPEAFKNTNNSFPSTINKLTILSTINEIGDEAFSGCNSIKCFDVSTLIHQPKWTGDNIFKGWNATGIFLCTSESAYQTNILDFFYNKIPGAWTIQKYAPTFIKDRSFSLLALSDNEEKKAVYGTAWILSDATPTIYDDYCYYIATNWHVTRKWETYVTSPYILAYSDTYVGDPASLKPDTYKIIPNFTIEDTDNFLFKELDEYKNEYYIPSIDLSILKVDFGSIPACKTKLDKLNTIQKTNGYINTFNKITASSEPKLKYTGGFPLIGNYCRWEFHSVFSSILEYKDWTTDAPKHTEQTFAHSISEPDILPDGTKTGTQDADPWYHWDCSPQLFCPQNMGLSFMPGGASGSMLIDQDYSVCGIYWGGWTTDSKSAYFPSFSLFNSERHNFIEKYI